MPLGDSVATQCRTREKQQTFLNVGRKVQQVHDLCNASLRYASEPGDIAVIQQHSTANESVVFDGECHQTSNTMQPTRCQRFRLCVVRNSQSGHGTFASFASAAWMTVVPASELRNRHFSNCQ